MPVRMMPPKITTMLMVARFQASPAALPTKKRTTPAITRGIATATQGQQRNDAEDDGAAHGQHDLHQHKACEGQLLRPQHRQQAAPGVKHPELLESHEGHAEILGEQGDDRAQHKERKQNKEEHQPAQNQWGEVLARVVEQPGAPSKEDRPADQQEQPGPDGKKEAETPEKVASTIGFPAVPAPFQLAAIVKNGIEEHEAVHRGHVNPQENE